MKFLTAGELNKLRHMVRHLVQDAVYNKGAARLIRCDELEDIDAALEDYANMRVAGEDAEQAERERQAVARSRLAVVESMVDRLYEAVGLLTKAVENT